MSTNMHTVLRRCATVVWLGAIVLFTLADAVASTPTPAERIGELRAQIEYHDDLYFRQAAPEISDQAYDRLKRELRELERQHPELVAAAGTGIGDDRWGRFPTRAHRVSMLSLEKSYTAAELQAFYARVAGASDNTEITWVLEPKYDGIAVSLTYENGRLTHAVTRGNGREGDEVTANARAIRGLPVELAGDDVPELVELRGEVYLTHDAFAHLNITRTKAGLEPFAHPRNLAAGSLKLTDPSEVAQRPLSVVIHGWGAWEPAASRPVRQADFHAEVAGWGLPAVEEHLVVEDFATVWTEVEACGERRWDWPFPTDGVVIKVNEVAVQDALGVNADAPNWAMAFKFSAEQAITRVRAIALQVGRTGQITPVAELEPVNIGGTTIARASLHNFSRLRQLDVRIGDTVQVEKAGEIIPQIVAVLTERRVGHLPIFPLPTECPECLTPLEVGAQVSILSCTNPDCPAQVRRRLEHFVSASGVDIKGIGPALIAKLVEAGLVQVPADLYRLSCEHLAALVGENQAEKMHAEIERSRSAPSWRALAGLGIPRVGPATAQRLVRQFGELDALARIRSEDLITTEGKSRVAGVGDATARVIAESLTQPAQRRQLQGLHAVGFGPASDSARQGPLQGRQVVLTGALPTLSRAEATRMIADAGGVVETRVTRETDYVVAGERPGAKLAAARQFGIKILDEAGLHALLAGHGGD